MAFQSIQVAKCQSVLSSRGVAFALSRLSHGPNAPTPIGIFRKVDRPVYGDMVRRQIIDAQASKGPGDLAALVRSSGTWTVS